MKHLQGQPRQLDGDLIETSDRLIVEVTPQALWLCVPQPAEDPDLAADADATREARSRTAAP